MKKLLSFFFVTIVLFSFSSCSVKAAKDKDIRRVKSVQIGDSKELVLEKLGKPLTIDNFGNFHYKFCSSKEVEFNTFTHIYMNVLTLGLWEPIGYAAEKMNDCDYEIVIVFDKEGDVSGAYTIDDYKIILKTVDIINDSLKTVKSSNKYILVYYDDNFGWFFVFKEKIDCAYKGKYIRAYFKLVPSTSFAIKVYKKYQKIPAFVNDIILFDPNENTFLEKSIQYIDKNGILINEEKTYSWTDIYPDTFQQVLIDSLSYYCVNKLLKEYKNAPDKPNMELRLPQTYKKLEL